MDNQKASTVIVPDVQFEAVQTASGNSLVFSLNENRVLHCTCEVPGDTHGWIQVDLSTAKATTDFPNQAVAVTHFDIGQDPVSSGVDLVMVLHANGQDHLYVSLGNTPDTWVDYTPGWKYVKFDDLVNNSSYATAPVNNVYLARYGSNQFAFVDLVTDPTTHTLSRYAVDYTGLTWQTLTGGDMQCWMPHNFPMTVQAGTLTSTIGCGPGDQGVNGVYTLGTNNCNANTGALVYTPLFNAGDATGPGYPTNFDLSKLSIDVTHMAMAVSARSNGMTDLFFASNGTLYFVPNEQQLEVNGVLPTLTAIYTHDLFKNVTSLHVNTWNDSNNDDPNGNIVLWGQSDSPDSSGTSQLFIMECAVGHEPDDAAPGVNGTAWSCPIPLLSNVVNSATYINNNYSALNSIDPTKGNAYGSCNVLFAQQVINEVSSLTQLFQDPVTTAWQERSLLTAPTPDNILTTIYNTTTYSTHIEITDENNITLPNVAVAIWASSPCSVYITDANNMAAYRTLDTAIPLNLHSDFSGNIGIMQPVDSIGGISYYIAVQDPTTKQICTEPINPLANTVSSLNAKIPDGDNDYLQGVQVTASDGTQSSLVSSTQDSQTKITSNHINTICAQNVHLDQHGLVSGQSWPDAATVAAAFSTVQAIALPAGKSASQAAIKPAVTKRAKPDRLARDIRFNAETDKIWGWTFGKNAQHYEGIEALKEMGLVVQAEGSLALTTGAGRLVGSDDWIEIKGGNLFKWLKNEASKLEQVSATFANGVVSCILTIADEVYHFVAKCANDIVNLVHTVLNAIETAFDDIVKWIGMIFSFKDIKNTHLVLKQMMKVYMDYVDKNIGSLDDTISYLFANIETDLSNALGVTATDQTYGGNMTNASAPKGSKSPSANWGSHHLKSNAANSSANYVPVTGDPIKDLLEVLYQKVIQEGENFQSMGNSFLALVETAAGMSITDLLAQVLNIVSDFLLNTAEDMLTAAVDVVKVLLTDFDSMLSQPMDIPVVSYLYKKITGDDLTPMDAVCFIAAIPATVVYKAVRGTAPFADDDPATAQLINAADLDAMQAILMPPALMGATIGIPGYHVQTGSTLEKINIVANISALTGAAVTSFVTAFKALSTIPTIGPGLSDKLIKRLTVLNAAAYFAYAAPDIVTLITTANKTENDHWYNVMNNMCMILGGAKAIVDGTTPLWPVPATADKYGTYIAPALDFIINVAWQVPTTAILVTTLDGRKASVQDANDIVGFIGGTTFDLSGILSPVLSAVSQVDDIPKREGLIAAVTGGMAYFNMIWGGACMATSFDGIHTT